MTLFMSYLDAVVLAALLFALFAVTGEHQAFAPMWSGMTVAIVLLAAEIVYLTHVTNTAAAGSDMRLRWSIVLLAACCGVVIGSITSSRMGGYPSKP